jgi:hypothetical protein
MAYNTANKEKIKEQARKNYRDNKEQRSKKAKEYRELNADKIKRYAKGWRESSDYMKLYREANKQSLAEYNKQWSQANMDSVIARNAIRKAKKLQSIPSWFESDLVNDVYEKARSLTASGIRTHVDHIVPLQSKFVCGLHCFNNLQLLDASANTSKGNRWWPDMW